MSDDPGPHQQLCRACLQSIPAGAKKCTHCDSYQKGFGRIFTLGQGALALGTGFLGALAAVLALFQSWPEPSVVDVRFVVANCDVETVDLAWINDGGRSGIFMNASLASNDGPVELDIRTEPQQSRLLKKTSEGLLTLEADHERDLSDCQNWCRNGQVEVFFRDAEYMAKSKAPCAG